MDEKDNVLSEALARNLKPQKHYKIIWDELEQTVETYDRRHRKKPIPYPKGSVQEAVDKAVREIGGNT